MVAEIIGTHWKYVEKCHKPEAWEILDAAYGDLARRYHSWSHIAELLGNLEEFTYLAARSEIIGTAIFWHDSIYLTRERDGSVRADQQNETESAALFLTQSLWSVQDGLAIRDMILASAHSKNVMLKPYYPGFEGDIDLFLDLDLSPLAAPWEAFVGNFRAIQFEFYWMHKKAFRNSQCLMLESFLKRVTIYRKAECRARWESDARSNIMRFLDRFKK